MRFDKGGWTLRVLAGLAVLFGALAQDGAWAATLNALQGDVMVNRGGGYRHVTGSVELNPGDTVVVGSGGAAEISYGDGCNVPVQPGAVATITQHAPCGGASGFSDFSGLGLSNTTLIVGGVVVAGGIAAAVALSGKNKAASP